MKSTIREVFSKNKERLIKWWKLEVQSCRHFVADGLAIDVKLKSLGVAFLKSGLQNTGIRYLLAPPSLT